MDKSNKHIGKEDFIRYLNGEMDSRERNEFERTLEANPFEAEALEGMESISVEKLSSDLEELKQKIYSRKNKKRSWYRVAAVAAILILGAGTVYTLLVQKPVAPTVTEIRTEEEQEVTPETKKAVIVEPIEPQIDDTSELPAETLAEIKEQPATAIEKDIEAPIATIVVDTYSIKASKPEAEASLKEPAIISGKFADAGVEKTESKNELSINTLKPRKKSMQAVPAMLNDTNPRTYTTQAKPVNFVVSGLVVSGEDNTPLPGATITLKGSQYGTVSDSNGQFNLKMPADTNLPIEASFIGMETTQLSDYRKSGNVITLEPDISGISEVVVTSSGIEPEQPAEVKTEAEPELGYREFYKVMKEKCLIPENYTPIKKRVRLRLTISESGKISNIEPINSPDSLLLQKSIELVKSGPTWSPAQIKGEPVESTAVIKLRFHE